MSITERFGWYSVFRFANFFTTLEKTGYTYLYKSLDICLEKKSRMATGIQDTEFI